MFANILKRTICFFGKIFYMFKFIYRKKLYVADDGLTMYIRGVKTEKKEGEAVEDRNDLESEKEKLLNESNPLAIALTVGGLFLFGLLAIICD